VNAADITRALNQAHEILSDPVARARYDQELAERRRVITIPARPVPQGAGLSVTMSAGDASLMFFHTFSPTPWS
jgi:curved DNA-binding protein CbpA